MEKAYKDKIEYASAVMCISSAITIGITSIVISEKHDIEAGVLIFIAQLLLFAASVYHVNYKLHAYGEVNNNKGNKE